VPCAALADGLSPRLSESGAGALSHATRLQSPSRPARPARDRSPPLRVDDPARTALPSPLPPSLRSSTLAAKEQGPGGSCVPRRRPPALLRRLRESERRVGGRVPGQKDERRLRPPVTGVSVMNAPSAVRNIPLDKLVLHQHARAERRLSSPSPSLAHSSYVTIDALRQTIADRHKRHAACS
jgi:hypothetical protein